MKPKEKTIDSTYIQQHLANERTFLAWIRTAVAIIGIGFLVANFHIYQQDSLSAAQHDLIRMIGILSIFLGISTIIIGTVSYYKKVRSINEQTFKTSKISLISLAIGMTLIFILIFIISFFLF